MGPRPTVNRRQKDEADQALNGARHNRRLSLRTREESTKRRAWFDVSRRIPSTARIQRTNLRGNAGMRAAKGSSPPLSPPWRSCEFQPSNRKEDGNFISKIARWFLFRQESKRARLISRVPFFFFFFSNTRSYFFLRRRRRWKFGFYRPRIEEDYENDPFFKNTKYIKNEESRRTRRKFNEKGKEKSADQFQQFF